jgi:hypothetical protein
VFSYRLVAAKKARGYQAVVSTCVSVKRQLVAGDGVPAGRVKRSKSASRQYTATVCSRMVSRALGVSYLNLAYLC